MLCRNRWTQVPQVSSNSKQSLAQVPLVRLWSSRCYPLFTCGRNLIQTCSKLRTWGKSRTVRSLKRQRSHRKHSYQTWWPTVLTHTMGWSATTMKIESRSCLTLRNQGYSQIAQSSPSFRFSSLRSSMAMAVRAVPSSWGTTCTTTSHLNQSFQTT